IRAFVAEIPSDYRRLIAEAFEKVTDKADLPLDHGRVGEEVFALERLRRIEAEAHMTGQKPDEQLKVILVGEAAELGEMLAGLLADAGASGFGVGQRALARHHAIFVYDVVGHYRLQRLEVGPEQEHTQAADAV